MSDSMGLRPRVRYIPSWYQGPTADWHGLLNSSHLYEDSLAYGSILQAGTGNGWWVSPWLPLGRVLGGLFFCLQCLGIVRLRIEVNKSMGGDRIWQDSMFQKDILIHRVPSHIPGRQGDVVWVGLGGWSRQKNHLEQWQKSK